MTRRFILHCGPPKTGTSAIQALLRDTPPRGLLYPGTGQWPDGAHHLTAFTLLGMTVRGDTEIPAAAALIDGLKAEIAEHEGPVILSSEHFTPETLPELVQQAGFSGDIRLVLSLRHPLMRAASAYNQAVKDPVIAERRLPDAFLREEGPAMALRPLVEAWSALPWPVTWLAYHPAATHVSRFLEATGLDPVETETPYTNRSMSGAGLVALLAAHRMGLDAKRREALSQALRSRLKRGFWGEGAPFPFSRGAAGAFLARIVKPDLDWLFRSMGLDFRDLHPHPPPRFVLKVQDREQIEACFATLNLNAARTERLHRVLGRFDMSAQKDPAHDDA